MSKEFEKRNPVKQLVDGEQMRVQVVRPVDSTGSSFTVKDGGSLDVNIQDQTTPLLDSYFLQEQSAFTIAADATASTSTTLQYDFTATTGHGITATDEIILLDVAADRSFYATVTNVATDVITLDRPIDYAFAAASTLGRIVVSDMAVDGSSTEQIYTIRAGVTPYDVTRIIVQMVHSGAGDDGKFGGIAALSRGLVMRVVNGVQKTIFNWKTNGDIRNFCYDVAYSDKAAGGENGTGARISFGGQDKHGVVIRLSGDDRLQFIVQDNLTTLTSLKIVAQGHEVDS